MRTEPEREYLPHSSHWGSFRARPTPDGRIEVRPHELDPEPYDLIHNVTDAARHPTRIDRPYVRRGWLDGDRSTRRGRDTFVPVNWEHAVQLVADELARVYGGFGPEAVFGGSYGWASAGRFHHAQSQVHRFLNLYGGYVRGVTNYSLGAALVVVPHVVGQNGSMLHTSSTWSDLIGNCELFVGFGGIATKNAAVNAGGLVRHAARGAVRDMHAAGCRFVNVGPLRSDLPDVPAQWIACRPGTDTALMLSLAHELIATDRVDTAFLHTHTVGYERLRDYVTGAADGRPKSPEWASGICDVQASVIRELAAEMAAKRTFVSVAPALQRAEHGEQPVWMGIALAAMLGGIGLPGGGFSVGHGSMGNYGNHPNLLRNPPLPQGHNPCEAFIPVARIADMLLRPGEEFDFDGRRYTYPDIRLVYWAGGNPFHHHQDLFRLHEAFQRPETVVVHEPFWTATARHADIVLPVTMTIEREDIAAASNEPAMIAMRQIVPPYAEARDDYRIFTDIAARHGLGERLTEGRSPREWIEALYRDWRERVRELAPDTPAFAEFWERGSTAIPLDPAPRSWLDWYRADPEGRPLDTPSGRIELYSETVAGFGYDDCPGHPVWREPEEWPGSPHAHTYPFVLVANQPSGKLHSQLDMGATSMATKQRGRESVTMHPADAAVVGVNAGDAVRVRSRRGTSFLGVVTVSDGVRRGVVRVPTGAWFDPVFDQRTCVSGNPNSVTRDVGTSRLGQGSTGQLCLVAVEPWTGPLPRLTVRNPPETGPR
ncbi:molybdopterin-dependent oxidoreductase [Streptomyces sp. NPDC048291]|uniref:molybdopterin-dependent oxidoreductase n=1 Tax=Streptomyces sp. NPDC048291 TaxID=3365530 RepID=UPI00371B2E4E